MPVKFDVQKTTIHQVFTAAVNDRKAQKPDTPTCLYVARRSELRFYAPANEAARDPVGVRDLLAQAIVNTLVEAHKDWLHKEPAERRIVADAILEHVLGERVAPSFAELGKLVKFSNQIGSMSNSSGGQESPELTHLMMDVMSRITRRETNILPDASAGDELAALQPHHAAALLLMRFRIDAEEGRDVADNVEHLSAARACLTGYMTTGQPVARDFFESSVAALEDHVPLQYALAEDCSSVLQAPQPLMAGYMPQMIELLTHITDPNAFRTVFASREAVARLESAVLVSGAADHPVVNAILEIVQKNSLRYDAFQKSTLSGAFGHCKVALEFQIEMEERLRGVFDPAMASGRQPVNELSRLRGEDQDAFSAATAARQGESKAQAIDDIRGWKDGYIRACEVQVALCDLMDADDPDETAGWDAVVSDLASIGEAECRYVYAYADTISELKTKLARSEGTITATSAAKLVILERNAARMESFMASPLSRNENFFDVDRVLLIPWWESVKDVLAAAPKKRAPPGPSSSSSSSGGSSGKAGARPVVLHARSAAIAEPSDDMSTQARAAAALDDSPATHPGRPAAGASAVPQVLIAGEPPRPKVETARTGKFKPKAREVRAAAARRSASAIDAGTGVSPTAQSPALAERQPRLAGSQNNERASTPTGRKKRRTPHHDASKHRWLPKALRDTFGRTGKSAAHAAAVGAERK